MRTLIRNRQKFYYQNLDSTSAVMDDGFYTGELDLTYADRKAGYANISAATGEAKEDSFGRDLQYDKVICADNDFEMNEYSRLWIDDLKADKPDYIVKRIAKSLNNVRIAISKVNAQ